MRKLWRLCAWGGAATTALAAVVLVTYTQTGSQRLQLAFTGTSALTEPRLTIAADPPNRDIEIRKLAQDVETRRLADAVRTLTADRDRLVARVATLERNIEDMTGTIKAAQAAAQTGKTPAKDVVKEALAVSQTMASAPETTVAHAEPAQATTQQQAEATEQIPLPPIRTAAAAATDTTTASIPAKPEYGLELASSSSADVLRAQWAMIKANYGPALPALQPFAVMRTRNGVTTYRLIAGPLPTIAAATQACARLAAARVACRPAKLEGQRLSQ